MIRVEWRKIRRFRTLWLTPNTRTRCMMARRVILTLVVVEEFVAACEVLAKKAIPGNKISQIGLRRRMISPSRRICRSFV